ncbi:hypothetical protein BH10BAC3_BH10BAC3_21630 [soil metagenome]
MKWLVRKGKSPTSDPEEKIFFEEIELKQGDGDPDLPEELYKLGFIKWVTYPGPDNEFKPLPKIKEQTKRKYEVFCGGFLYYHDEEFKKYSKGKGYTDEKGYPEWKEYPPDSKFEHRIYFEWFNLKGKDKVSVYINPTPPEFNTNPPKPPPPPPPES